MLIDFLNFIEPYMYFPIALLVGMLFLIPTTLFRGKIINYTKDWNKNVLTTLNIIKYIVVIGYISLLIYLFYLLCLDII